MLRGEITSKGVWELRGAEGSVRDPAMIHLSGRKELVPRQCAVYIRFSITFGRLQLPGQALEGP